MVPSSWRDCLIIIDNNKIPREKTRVKLNPIADGIQKRDKQISDAFHKKWRNVMAISDRIETNPKIMMGKPVIRGTRIPVELILRKLSEKATEADLLQVYPQLVAEDIQASIRFAGHDRT